MCKNIIVHDLITKFFRERTIFINKVSCGLALRIVRVTILQ